MNGPDSPPERTGPGSGATTAAAGTPFPVDLARDRRARTTWAVLLAGPVIWFAHFMVVYLVAEAGCTGDGDGLELFDPPVPQAVTILTTVVAVLACLGCAAWARRRWRANREDIPGGSEVAGEEGGGDGGGRRPELAFSGMLLSLLSAVTVLSVGLPALFLRPC